MKFYTVYLRNGYKLFEMVNCEKTGLLGPGRLEDIEHVGVANADGPS